MARTQRAEVIAPHTDAQRLLAPVAVVNPHAPTLGFSDRATRHRRDNAKYLGLIRAVALAHQHQRPRKQVEVEGQTVTYIEATAADVAAAERLCAHVLGTTADELSPATRRLSGGHGDFADGRNGAPLHPPGAAGGDRDGRQPAEGAPGPLGRPRVRGRRPGRAGHHLRAGSALTDSRYWAIGRVGTAIGRVPAGGSAGYRPVFGRKDTRISRPPARLLTRRNDRPESAGSCVRRSDDSLPGLTT